MKTSIVLGTSFLLGAAGIAAIDTNVKPESSATIWLNETAPAVEVVQEEQPQHVNHGTNKVYGSVVVDIHDATGPPEMDNYPVGPPQTGVSSDASANFGVVTR